MPWSIESSGGSASPEPAWSPLKPVSLAYFYGIAALTGGVLALLTAKTVRRIGHRWTSARQTTAKRPAEQAERP